MAISFIQSRHLVGNGSLNLAFNSGNSAGSAIIAAVIGKVGDTFSVSDTNLNSYNSVASFTDNAVANQLQIFFSFGIASGANTVSLGGVTIGAQSSLAIHEFSVINSKDVSSTPATGVGNTQTSNTINTNFANELLFGFIGGQGSGLLTISNGAGFTTAESDIATNPAFITEYQIVSSTGTYSASSTTTAGKGGNLNWGAQIVSFFQSGTTTRTSIIGFGF